MRSLKAHRCSPAVLASFTCTFGMVGTATISYAQSSQLLPPSRQEIADEEAGTWTLKKFPTQPTMKELYWQFPAETPAFFRDSLLQSVSRSYYLPRDNFDGSESEAWAAGGWLAFRSGLICNLFGVHAAYYTSQKLYGPLDKDGTKLLAEEQEPIEVLGQIYGRMQILDQELRGGRQLVDTPLINAQDSRMVPNTFEGGTVVTLPDKDRNYDYSVGYLWSVKQRDSNDFIPMSEALAGDEDVEQRGAVFAMLRYRPVKGLSIVGMDYYLPDFVNTGFAQAEYSTPSAKDEVNWNFGANVIEQGSVGDALLFDDDFETYQAAAKVQLTYAGLALFVAGSITGDESKIYSPFGTKPNYTDMQQVSFDNANEKAIGGSIAYDFGYAFSSIGLSGLTAGAWYTAGSDAIDPSTQTEIDDRSELDLWIQYRPTIEPCKGLRVKVQYADVWQNGNERDDQSEFRFIVDYTVLVRPPLE